MGKARSCESKVALVTGAAGRGMGRSIALTLAREGAPVVVNYRTSKDSAEAIVGHITGRGGEAVAVQADVFDAEGCGGLCEAAIGAFGRIGICIVGPGAGWHDQPPEKLDHAGALDDARHELAPLYYLMPLVLPGMMKRRWGRLVGISVNMHPPTPCYAYAAAKAARTRAMLLVADGAWPGGVTVNVVAPGPVAEITTLEEAIEQCDHGTAWGSRSNVSPQDVAEGVAFLCSEAGRFVTGCELPYSWR
jgi:3-oxoacyl-[acyl-carrier protein] reductase